MTETIPTKTVLVDYKYEQELLYRPVKTRGPWERRPGQGADGYGQKIATDWAIDYDGIERHIYCTQISNAGSCWFMAGGHKIFVS